MNCEDIFDEDMQTLELNEPEAPFGKTFENLEAWKRACRLCVQTYNATQDWSDWGFRDQIRRASVSIPSNIAEGSERGSKPDYIRFLRIAKGSGAELRTQLHIASKANELVSETKELSRMLQGLINNLQSHVQ